MGSSPESLSTLEQVKDAIEKKLDEYLEAPEVIVDVSAYNSKFYYVISDGAGLGDGVLVLAVALGHLFDRSGGQGAQLHDGHLLHRREDLEVQRFGHLQGT